jgi:hypothetical protein
LWERPSFVCSARPLEANDEWQLQHRYLQTQVMTEPMLPMVDALPPQISTVAALIHGRLSFSWWHPRMGSSGRWVCGNLEVFDLPYIRPDKAALRRVTDGALGKKLFLGSFEEDALTRDLCSKTALLAVGKSPEPALTPERRATPANRPGVRCSDRGHKPSRLSNSRPRVASRFARRNSHHEPPRRHP